MSTTDPVEQSNTTAAATTALQSLLDKGDIMQGQFDYIKGIILKHTDDPQHTAFKAWLVKHDCSIFGMWVYDDMLAAWRASDCVGDLERIMTKFGMSALDVSKMSRENMMRFLMFRMAHKHEELQEATTAVTKGNADDLIDSLVDLWYMCVGTLVAFGVDVREAWRRVHAANMAKEPGINPKRPNPAGLPDMLKPDDWTPPTHKDNVGLLDVAMSVRDDRTREMHRILKEHADAGRIIMSPPQTTPTIEQLSSIVDIAQQAKDLPQEDPPKSTDRV